MIIADFPGWLGTLTTEIMEEAERLLQPEDAVRIAMMLRPNLVALPRSNCEGASITRALECFSKNKDTITQTLHECGVDKTTPAGSPIYLAAAEQLQQQLPEDLSMLSHEHLRAYHLILLSEASTVGFLQTYSDFFRRVLFTSDQQLYRDPFSEQQNCDLFTALGSASFKKSAHALNQALLKMKERFITELISKLEHLATKWDSSNLDPQ